LVAPDLLIDFCNLSTQAYEYHTDLYQQRLDEIRFTPSQGICTPSPSPASYLPWLHPAVPLSPVPVYHEWGTHPALTALPSTPVFFHSTNQLRTNLQASHQRTPFGNLTNIPESRPTTKLTGERRGWKLQKNRRTAHETHKACEDTAQEKASGVAGDSGQKVLNLELTESLKEQIRCITTEWCNSKGATCEEEPPLAVVEYAKLLLTLGYELPNTLEEGAAGQQLGANARQRRTIRRSRERAIKAIEELHK
jgi:hypothetical protein